MPPDRFARLVSDVGDLEAPQLQATRHLNHVSQVLLRVRNALRMALNPATPVWWHAATLAVQRELGREGEATTRLQADSDGRKEVGEITQIAGGHTSEVGTIRAQRRASGCGKGPRFGPRSITVKRPPQR